MGVSFCASFLLALDQNFQRTLNDDAKEIQQITDSYSNTLRAHPAADGSGEVRERIKELSKRWEAFNETVHEAIKNVRIDSGRRKIMCLVFS